MSIARYILKALDDGYSEIEVSLELFRGFNFDRLSIWCEIYELEKMTDIIQNRITFRKK